jgi:hypothetical protein
MSTQEDDFESAFDEFAKETEPAEAPVEPAEPAEAPVEPAAPAEPAEPYEDPAPAEAPDINTLRAERDRYLHQVRSNEGRVSAMQRRINELSQAVQQREAALQQLHTRGPQGAVSAPPGDMSQADWQKFREDFPEVAQAVDAHVSHVVSNAVSQHLGSIKAEIEPIRQAEHERFLQSQFAALEAAHPDWRDVVQNDDFREWLRIQPSAVQQYMESEDAGEASWLVSQYKLAATTRRIDPSAQQAEAIRASRNQRLVSSQSVPGRRVAERPLPEDDFDAAFQAYARRLERRRA